MANKKDAVMHLNNHMNTWVVIRLTQTPLAMLKNGLEHNMCEKL